MIERVIRLLNCRLKGTPFIQLSVRSTATQAVNQSYVHGNRVRINSKPIHNTR
jgi:hypothetical protein